MANRRQGIFAWAKQSALGTPAGAPTYAVPMSAGGGPKPVRDIADLPITRPSSARAGQYVQRARGEGTLTILAHETEIGSLLLAVAGSEEYALDTNSVPNHRFVITEDFEVWLTCWVMLADDWWRFDDVNVTMLGLAGTSGENVLVNLGFLARHYAPHVVAPTYSLAPDEPRFKYIGSEIYVAPLGRAPTGPFTQVENVDLEIRRNPTPRYGTELTPAMLVPIREMDLSMGFTYDPDELDWDLTTVSATGSLTGTGESQDLGQGSARVKFGRHPALASHFLEFYTGPGKGTVGAGGADVAPFSANWEFVAERPDPDPGGGPIDIAAAGRLIDPPENPGTSEVTVLLAGGKVGAY